MYKFFTLYFLISSCILYTHEDINLERFKQKMSELNRLDERLTKLCTFSATLFISENKKTYFFALASLLKIQIFIHHKNLSDSQQSLPEGQQINTLLQESDTIIQDLNRQMRTLRSKFSPFPFTR